MFNRQSIHVAMLLWGCIFCLIAAVCMIISRNFDKGKRRWLTGLQLTCAALLGSDALAWIYRGVAGNVGFLMVKISNFLVFVLSDAMLFIFHGYICCCLFGGDKLIPEKQGKLYPLKRIMIVYIIAVIGVIMVVVSQFTNLYYYIDADNLYHRNTIYPLSLIIPLIGFLLDISLTFQFRKNISHEIYVSLMAYYLLIGAATLLTFVYYGISFINISICIAMILIFITSMIQQNNEMALKEKEAADLRISLMLSQIAPHFIYNSLTTIQGLCEKDPKMAKETVGEFARYLRGNLDSLNEENMIPFEKEIKHVESYLAIEKKRFGDKVKVKFNIEDEAFVIPPLTLQILVENAVKHGICKRDEGGTVTINVERKVDNIYITVKDDGVGFDVDKMMHDGGSHIGFSNARSRLKSMCGGSLMVESQVGVGTTAVIALPLDNIQGGKHEDNSSG